MVHSEVLFEMTMLWKLLFVASLAVGAFGRTVLDSPSYETYDPYENYADKITTEYCKATKNEDKKSGVKASFKSFAKCLAGLFDTDTVQKELEKATNNGVYDYIGIIKEYCVKAPQLKKCISGLIKGVAPCLPPGEVEPRERSTYAVLDFVCDNDGARIETFVKEGGPQCVKTQQLELSYCQRDMKTNVTKISNVYGGGAAGALLIPGKDKCTILDQAMTYFIDALKRCSNPTPGNLAQELHDVHLSSLSCNGETLNHIAVTPGKLNNAAQSPSLNEELEQLTKRKLELEVRTAELEIWKRENELNVQHTGLTSDIKHI